MTSKPTYNVVSRASAWFSVQEWSEKLGLEIRFDSLRLVLISSKFVWWCAVTAMAAQWFNPADPEAQPKTYRAMPEDADVVFP